MAKTYVSKQVTASPYRIDNRAIVNAPARPIAKDIVDGPTVTAISGVRVNDDVYPWSSGT